MAFTSKLYPGELVIDDATELDIALPPPGHGRGYIPEARPRAGYEGIADPFPAELLIPRSEWQARIQEQEKRKTRLSDLMNQAGLPCKDQAQTNYCWIFGPCHTIEMVRVIQNEPMVLLSPASVGGPMTNFRNVGGWGGPGLEYAGTHGFVPVDKWPQAAIDRSYNTAENQALALNYRQSAWYEIQPRNLDQLISCLLRGIPTTGGYNWWRHQITIYDAVWLDGTVATRIRNSWGKNWPTAGANGYGILQGTRMLPDDACAPRLALAA